MKFTWPASYSLARAYLDQLERSQGMNATQIADARAQLDTAEKLGGPEQQQTLTQLVSRLESEANGAGDGGKVRLVAGAVKQLAASPNLATK